MSAGSVYAHNINFSATYIRKGLWGVIMQYEVEAEEEDLFEEDMRSKSHDDFYDTEYAEEALENDQISWKEAGFLMGYTKRKDEEDFWEINEI